MGTGHDPSSITKILSGTTADTITIDQLWPQLQITNSDVTNTLWVRVGSTATPAAAVAGDAGCIPVLPSTTRIIQAVPIQTGTGIGTVVVSVVGNGGSYTVTGVNLNNNAADTLAQITALGLPVFLPEAYGAIGDGTTDDTTAVRATIAAAVAASVSTRRVVYLSRDYLCGALTCAGTRITFTGPGTIIQKAAGANLLDMAGSTDCVIDGLTFRGITGTVPASANNGVYGSGSAISRLEIRNCVFENLQFQAIWIKNGVDVWVRNCHGRNLCEGMKFTGVTRGGFIDCSLRDPATPAATFIDGFSLDSTSGHAYGVCSDIVIEGCMTKGYVDAQSLLVHAGIGIRIASNVFEDCGCGISVNPFQVGDTAQDITIVGNVIRNTSTAGIAGGVANQGIVVGGGATYRVDTVTIVGNTVRNANAIVQDTAQGGISIGYADHVTVIGNVVAACYVNGILITAPGLDIVVSNNHVTGVIAVSGNQVGIYMPSAAAGASGLIVNNVIDGGAGLASAIRADATSASMRLGNNVILGSFTNAVTGPNRFAAFDLTSSALPTNPPVSGTTYRNNTGQSLSVWLPAYATTPGTAGTVAVSVSTVTPASSTKFTQYVNGTSTSSLPDMVNFTVPPGFFFSVTLTGVTLATGYGQTTV